MNTEQNDAAMNLLILGATGGTGRQLVEQALAAGHRVTAFVRDPTRLDIQHQRLSVVTGDATDAGDLAAAVRGKDAVLSALGAPASSKSWLRAVSTENTVRAMAAAGVERIVSLSSLGVGDSRAGLPFFLRHVVMPFYLERGMADHARQEDRLRESGLKWTIVRPPFLTDGGRTGRYQHGFAVDADGLKYKISRADVAEFMLRQLRDETYLRKAAALSY